MKLKHLSLIISICIVLPAAFVYGFDLFGLRSTLFVLPEPTTDYDSMLKSIMGFYLCCVAVFLLGIFNPKWWRIAIILNIVLMLGVGSGRVVSILTSGLPSTAFALGVVGELVLATLSFWLLRKYGE